MKRKILSWSLVLFWMGLIFYFSHQPATESSELRDSAGGLGGILLMNAIRRVRSRKVQILQL